MIHQMALTSFRSQHLEEGATAATGALSMPRPLSCKSRPPWSTQAPPTPGPRPTDPATHCVSSYRYLTTTQGMTNSAGAPVQTPSPPPTPPQPSARAQAPPGLRPAQGGCSALESGGDPPHPPEVDKLDGPGSRARGAGLGGLESGVEAHPSRGAGTRGSGPPPSRPPAPAGCAGTRPPPAATCSWRPRSTGSRSGPCGRRPRPRQWWAVGPPALHPRPAVWCPQ